MPKKPLPDFVAPMQASSVKEPFDSPDWIFETKLDGYRAIAALPTILQEAPAQKAHKPIIDSLASRSSRRRCTLVSDSWLW